MIATRRDSVAFARATLIPNATVALEAVRGGGRESSARERVEWHEKQADKTDREIKYYEKLCKKLAANGMPTADAFDVLEPALRNVLR